MGLRYAQWGGEKAVVVIFHMRLRLNGVFFAYNGHLIILYTCILTFICANVGEFKYLNHKDAGKYAMLLVLELPWETNMLVF